MKHTCSGCGNNLFEIITYKQDNVVCIIVCNKCKRNVEIRIPIDKDELEQLKKDLADEIIYGIKMNLTIHNFINRIKKRIDNLEGGKQNE